VQQGFSPAGGWGGGMPASTIHHGKHEAIFGAKLRARVKSGVVSFFSSVGSGSGSGRIRIILAYPDPDRHQEHADLDRYQVQAN
jgi:hypothetical protein